jgi:hypothetical protein
MINFEATLKALSERGVNFVVIGGYAATLHGSAYLIRGLDICYERTPENMERLVSALSPYHPRLRGAPEGLPFLFDVQTLSNGMNFSLATDLGDIDLLGHLSGFGEFPAVALDAISMPLFGGEYRVASLDSLIEKGRGQEQRPECPARAGGAKRNACAKRTNGAAAGLTAKLAIGRDGADRSAIVPAPVQRRQQLCST